MALQRLVGGFDSFRWGKDVSFITAGNATSAAGAGQLRREVVWSYSDSVSDIYDFADGSSWWFA